MTIRRVKATLKLFMLVLFAVWILIWFLRPTSIFTHYWKLFTQRISTRAFGAAGGYVIVYAAPVIILATIGAIYLQLNSGKSIKKKSRVWSYPVMLRGPLALASVVELAILVVFVGLLTWTLSESLSVKYATITSQKLHKAHLNEWQWKLQLAGYNFGLTGVVCLAFLLFPVARASVFLRLLNIPLENAVKYHIWIANLMMIIFTAHGTCFIVLWFVKGTLKEAFRYRKTEITGFLGLLTWIIGATLWITSIYPIRKRMFELFYFTHQLSFLFILAFALHVGDQLYYISLGGILLFFVDRLMRFLQSRSAVDVLSARRMSLETFELTIAKHPSLQYYPGSFIMVNVPVVSALQWHPFTLVSSSKPDTHHVSILVKCCGEWTLKLRDHLLNPDINHTFHLQAAVEGPYGHNPNYMFLYKGLIFIAGGSGISPYISILRDLVYDIENGTLEHPLPSEILLIWCIKKSDELSILQLFPPLTDSSVQVKIYVTREHEVDLEKVNFNTGVFTVGEITRDSKLNIPRCIYGTSVSCYGLTILASFIGVLTLLTVINWFCIYPVDHNTRKFFPLALNGLLAFSSTLFGVIVFGGVTAAVSTWFSCRNKASAPEENCSTTGGNGTQANEIHYGMRPEFHDIFATYANRFTDEEVGVFVCGSRSMQQSVASGCRRYNFNYHYFNYDL